MSEMSKVEEVARAIYDELAQKNVGAGDNLRSVYVADQIDLVALAKAAIEPMRKPTKTMIEAGNEQDRYDEGSAGAELHWQVMIDAALKEGDPSNEVAKGSELTPAQIPLQGC